MIPIVIPVSSNSTKLSNMPLGMLLRVTEDGVDVNYELAGFDAYGANTATFVRKDIYGTSTRLEHYADSAIDTLCNTTIFGKFTSALRAKILEVTLTLATSASTSTTINRKCFLPTMTNMGFGNNNGTAEGGALGLYTYNQVRIKNMPGTAANWWLSSWVGSSSARIVSTTGALSAQNRSVSNGVVPAFVLSSNEQVQFPPNSDGSYSLAEVTGMATGGGGTTVYAITTNRPLNYYGPAYGVPGDKIVFDHSGGYYPTIEDENNNEVTYSYSPSWAKYFTMPESDVTITLVYD